MRAAALLQIAVLHQLAHVVGNVGALVVAALHEFTDAQFGIAQVEEDQGLNVVEVADIATLKLGLDDLERKTVQALDQRDCLYISFVHVPSSFIRSRF